MHILLQLYTSVPKGPDAQIFSDDLTWFLIFSNIFRKMEEDDIILSFKGDITQDLLASVYQIMEARLESEKEEPKR